MTRLAVFAVVAALAATGSHAAGRPPRVVEIESPAGDSSGEPFLASAGGAAYLSWFEEVGEGTHALRLARWDGVRWDKPRTVASGDDLFVNWADFPSVLPLPDGKLVAHWPARNGDGTYSYDVAVVVSDDGGHSWSEPVSPHRDGTPTEHGFVSLLPVGAGDFDVVWLDGRKFAAGDGHGDASREMTLMYGRYREGAFLPEQALDLRVCDCCQTGAATTPGGMIVAYRDRSATETRDISTVRLHAGEWSEPRTLHDDGWEIPACPVNGPTVAADEALVAIAWFTAPPRKADPAEGDTRSTPLPAKNTQVLVAFSRDGGRTFAAPIRVDQGRPAGRVDVEMPGDGSAMVSWLERTDDKIAAVRARRVHPDGTLGAPATVATTGGGRASGFPRMTRLGDEILIAWTDTGEPARVRVARLLPAGTER